MSTFHSHHHKPKVMFLLKRNFDSGGYNNVRSGLFNSCRLLLQALFNHILIRDGKVIVVTDGNSIDRELHQFKPDICFLEAVWVTPLKLLEVQHLHPKVKFIVRVHSNIPFLAHEGNAIEWLTEYEIIPNVTVAFNNKKTASYLNGIFATATYLPNVYEAEFRESCAIDGMLNMGCFGAIRPLKNQLSQAIAAIRFANSLNLVLHFHINAYRIEQNGEGILKNLRALFNGTQHRLVEHKWLTHDEFMDLIKTMDVGMQVSFTESFNIISADFVYAGVPIIVSHDIDWMNSQAMVDCNNIFEIQDKIEEVLKNRHRFIKRAQRALKEYNKESINVWEDFLE